MNTLNTLNTFLIHYIKRTLLMIKEEEARAREVCYDGHIVIIYNGIPGDVYVWCSIALQM
jgi:hypothetical protein